MIQKLFQGLFLALLVGTLAFATVTVTSTPAEAGQIDCDLFHPPAGCDVRTIAVDGGFCCEFYGPNCTPSLIGPCWR